MFSIRVTPEARAAILEQFVLMELREPGLVIYRQPPTADVVRSADGQAQWTVQRAKGYVVRFTELPQGTIDLSPALLVDGIRIFPASINDQPSDATATLTFQDGKLYAEDTTIGTQARSLNTQEDGIRLGLLPQEEVVSSSAAHRLRLFTIASGEGFNFHSLQFEAVSDDGWRPEVCLTQKQFQGQHKFWRWISGLHRVQDDSGVALICVGEGSRPIENAMSNSFSYSWRAWDLHRNLEVRRLKDCAYPNEPLE